MLLLLPSLEWASCLVTVVMLVAISLRKSCQAIRIGIGSRCAIVVGALIAGEQNATSVPAAALNAGDIVIAVNTLKSLPIFPYENDALLRVDPITGDRTVISDSTHGAGPLFALDINSAGLSRLPDGRLFLAAENGLFSIDPATGDRTLLSSAALRGLTYAGGQLFALGPSDVLRIDTVTGASTVLVPQIKATAISTIDGQLLVASNHIEQYTSAGAHVATFPADSDGATAIAAYGEKIVITTMSSNNHYFNRFAPDPLGRTTLIDGANVIGMAIDANGYMVASILSGPGNTALVRQQITPFHYPLDVDYIIGPLPADDFQTIYGLVIVPEPGTLILGATGFFSLVLARKCLHRQTRML